jgi:hypothetical protein
LSSFILHGALSAAPVEALSKYPAPFSAERPPLWNCAPKSGILAEAPGVHLLSKKHAVPSAENLVSSRMPRWHRGAGENIWRQKEPVSIVIIILFFIETRRVRVN